MKTPLKIAIYSGEIPSTTFIERLITGLSQSGTQVLLFGVKHKLPAYSNQVTVLGYKPDRLSKFLYVFKFTVLLTLFKRHDKKRLDTYLKQQHKTDLYTKVKYYPVLWHQPDVFHVQWAKGLDDWMWVQDFGMKLVLSLRGAHINYSPIADETLAVMYSNCFPKVDGFHAVSKAIGLEAEKYGANANRIHVVYSGLDLNVLKANVPKVSATETRFKMISVGRPHWKKGYSYMLDACKQLKDSGFHFNYIIVGGSDTIEYQYHIHDLGLTDNVQLISKKRFQDVQHLIQESDLLVLPSVEEGIANVVLEAMASGTLVLSTDCGGMQEVIRDGETGFLVPIRDSKSLAHKISAIANLQPAEKKHIREIALQTITKSHTIQQMVESMFKLYQRVLNV